MHLYIHIPFCRQACHYCDFHFSTNLSRKSALVDALCAEIILRTGYLPNTELETIYFGGGTPSLLTDPELQQLFDTIHAHFTVAPQAEITLEANPDDLTPAKLTMLRRYVNRLSIGIQTFDEDALRWMNRAHTATEAETCVRLAREAGFENMSADLIYGIPNRPESRWTADIQKLLALDLSHLSTYALTIEPNTAFERWERTGRQPPADENMAAEHYEQLTDALTGAAYDQYEISSFARLAPDGSPRYARHNTAYWQHRPYLGIGPSAHSYNGHSRQYNIASNARYIAEIGQGVLPATVEELTPADQVNDYLLTGLRTKWGCSVAALDRMLGSDFALVQARDLSALYASGWLARTGDQLQLTRSGKLFADRVASTLFVVQDH